MRRSCFSLLMLVSLILAARQCVAEEISFEATVDKSHVTLNQSIVLSLNFQGTQSMPAPTLSGIDGFHVKYIGPTTMMSIVNGRMSASITHRYVLLPLKEGTFQLGPFSFEYRGDTYTARSLTVEVSDKPFSAGPQRQGSDKERMQLEDKIFLVMEVSKNKAYLNEVIPVTIKLYIDRLGVRDIEYPRLTHEGFSIEALSKPRQYEEVLGGIAYDVIEFKTKIFGTQTGTFNFGPAELKCNLILREQKRRSSSVFDDVFGDDDMFDDFFGRYTKYPLILDSNTVPITVLPFPEEGRPEGFSGAVGDFEFTVEAEPREVKVGDPITLKMSVSGEGNFKTVLPPPLDFKDDFKIYDPEVKKEDGAKTFEQAIIPKDTNIKEIPQISFSFFDTKKGKYREVTKGPIPIKVNPLPKGEGLKILGLPGSVAEGTKRKEILGRDIIYIKDAPGTFRPKNGFLYRNRLFVAIQLIPLLLVISVLIFERRKNRLRTDIRYARRLRAPHRAKRNLSKVRQLLGSGNPDKFYDAAFKAMQEYLGDKFHLPTAGITSDVVEELKSRNIDEGLLAKLKECFNNCDMARYAPSAVTKDQMQATRKLLEEIIDTLERVKI